MTPETDYAVNIMRVWKYATPEDIAKGIAWYHDAMLLASDIAGGDVWKGAGVLSAFSPRQPWPINVRNARTALFWGTAAGHRPALHTRQQVKTADRIIRGAHPLDVMKGDKTRSFAEAIATGGHGTIATIDRHAHDIAEGHADFTDVTRAIGKVKYRNMAAAYAEVADYVGHSVNIVQAVTWEAWRRNKGVWEVWRDAVA